MLLHEQLADLYGQIKMSCCPNQRLISSKELEKATPEDVNKKKQEALRPFATFSILGIVVASGLAVQPSVQAIIYCLIRYQVETMQDNIFKQRFDALSAPMEPRHCQSQRKRQSYGIGNDCQRQG